MWLNYRRYLVIVPLLFLGCNEEERTTAAVTVPSDAGELANRKSLTTDQLCEDYRGLISAVDSRHYYKVLLASQGSLKDEYLRRGRRILWRTVLSRYPKLSCYDSRIANIIQNDVGDGCTPELEMYSVLDTERATIQLSASFNLARMLAMGMSAHMLALDPHSVYEPAYKHNDTSTYGFSLYPDERIWYGGLFSKSLLIAGVDAAITSGAYPLKAGDRILTVNDVPVDEYNPVELNRLLQAPTQSGKDIRLTIARPGCATASSVQLYSLDLHNRTGLTSRVLDMSCGICYIKISDFMPQTPKAFREAVLLMNMQLHPHLKSLRPKGRHTIDAMRVLVLDLRGSPGGLVNAAANIFYLLRKTTPFLYLSEGQSLPDEVELRSYADMPQYFSYSNEHLDVPVVVMVDKHSRSAAEILARLLQYYKVGIVVGSTTYGKATMQRLRNAGELLRAINQRSDHPLRGTFLITEGMLYTADKNTYQMSGVVPDFCIRNPELEKLIKEYRARNPQEAISEATHQNPIDPRSLPGAVMIHEGDVTDTYNIVPSQDYTELESFFQSRKTPLVLRANTAEDSGDQVPFAEDRELQLVKSLLIKFYNRGTR